MSRKNEGPRIRKGKQQAPSPGELDVMVTQIVNDALGLVMGYRILHRAAYDSTGSGSTTRISGGDASAPVIEALSSGSQDRLRSTAESIGRRVKDASQQLDNARTEVNKTVGRRFRQPTKPSARATVDGNGLQAAVERRTARMARGEE